MIRLRTLSTVFLVLSVCPDQSFAQNELIERGAYIVESIAACGACHTPRSSESIPIDTRTATWLKAELERRFNWPVKYLIYSTNHDGHAFGAAVYDEAIIVAQENIVPAPEMWRDMSIRFDEFEGFGGDREKFRAWRKANSPELPHITFKDRMTIKLGGKQVNLISLGKGPGEDSLVVHYPAERAVLAVDTVWVDRLPYAPGPGLRFPPTWAEYYPEYFDSLRITEESDFDILLVGHGIHGTGRGAVGNSREALYAKILEAKANGLTREQAMETIELPQYRHLGMYDQWFKNNVSGMWRHIFER
jgi:glyoxylase-like metal-dependent hydrolase (beta-lactamase superfamily II)